MGVEIKGYYDKQTNRLLQDFNKTIELIKVENNQVVQITDSLQQELLTEYDKIIPEIPYFEGYRQKMFNRMLIITSQILAVYRVLTRYGKKPEEIWIFCDEALLLRLQAVPRWRRWFINQFWHRIFGVILKKRGKQKLKETLGNFELEYIFNNGKDFDFGINYIRCGHYKFLKDQQALEIFPYVCLADIALSNAFGWGLIRTHTIADGFPYCDFRFKHGSITKVSSKTPEVQKTIDKLRPN